MLKELVAVGPRTPILREYEEPTQVKGQEHALSGEAWNDALDLSRETHTISEDKVKRVPPELSGDL